MNILFVITRADAIGGAQVHVKDLAVALQQDQHKVLVIGDKLSVSTSCQALKNRGVGVILNY